MLRLEFATKSAQEKEKVVNKFYDDLIKRKRKLKMVEDFCRTNYCEILNTSSSKSNYPYFEQVVKADLDTLKKIKAIQVSYKDDLIRYMTTLYDSINKRNFCDQLNVTVCPYCDRIFINSSHSNSKCQLDHFFPKDKYHILKVSFYNLVPVCGQCNFRKSNKLFAHNPYDERYSTDDLLTFTYNPKEVNLNKNNITIKIKYLNRGMNIKKDMDRLEMADLYQIHKERVLEVINESKIYTPTYINSLMQSFPGVFNTPSDVKQSILDSAIDEKDYSKRPLSKMISDIARETGIL